MAITDERAIKFSNEQIRPMAEKIRDLKFELESMLTDWNGGINVLFPVDPDDMLEDGREANGDSRLSGNDVVGIVVQASTIFNQLDGVGVMDVIQKPCVRTFRS